MKNAPRTLCICADDFGLSPGIDRAILALVAQRRISAVGCMVRRDAWAEDRSALKDIDPAQVDIGLHLDLTHGPGGGFAEASLPALIGRCYLRQVGARHVRTEIRAQLAKFERAMGRPPAFVDGHRHVHQLPVVREQLVEELVQRYGDATPWLRNTARAEVGRERWGKADTLHALGGGALQRLAAHHGVRMSRRLLGVYGFEAHPGVYSALLTRWIAACQSGDLLMCHPAIEPDRADPIGAARPHEFLALEAVDLSAGGQVVVAPLSRHLRRTAHL